MKRICEEGSEFQGVSMQMENYWSQTSKKDQKFPLWEKWNKVGKINGVCFPSSYHPGLVTSESFSQSGFIFSDDTPVRKLIVFQRMVFLLFFSEIIFSNLATVFLASVRTHALGSFTKRRTFSIDSTALSLFKAEIACPFTSS